MPHAAACLLRFPSALFVLFLVTGCGRQDRNIEDGGLDDSGQSCSRHEQCGVDMLCNDLTCEPAYGRLYRIGITNVNLSRDHSPDGGPWDDDGTGPDPIVCFVLTIDDESEEHCTNVEEDTFSPIFDSFTAEVMLEENQMFEVLLCEVDPAPEETACWTVGLLQGVSVVHLRTGTLTFIPDDPSRLDDWAVTISFDAI